MLRQNGYFPVKIEKAIQFKDIRDLSFGAKISSKDISVFCRQFAAMSKAGIPIVRCLDILSGQVSNRIFARLLTEVHSEVYTGTSLSRAFKKRSTYFPLLFTSMIEAGETSGTLDIIMDSLARHYEKDHRLKQKIKNSMTYPALVLLVALGVMYFLLATVVPTFVSVLTRSEMQLPFPTKLLLSLSGFLSGNGIFILLFLFLAVSIICTVISREDGHRKWHSFLLKLPVVKRLIVLTAATRFAAYWGSCSERVYH